MGVQARHGKAYDGYTLSDAINYAVSLTNVDPIQMLTTESKP